mmetsp:Transcript_129868/g.224513  ORF Transcript_129868/g.224513 Transcript_129868/m.224513 type:complete len:87 (+) Transcript_129868:425-685(+)
MVRDLQGTTCEHIPAERDARVADGAARALSNLLLPWSHGSHSLASTILDMVHRRILGQDEESFDSVIVEGMADTLRLLRDNTEPQE